MGFCLDHDLGDVDPTKVEDGTRSGGLVPAGKYHARFIGDKDVTSSKQTTGTELHFEILAGPQKGQTVKETLWNSDKDAGKNRVLLFARRLGLLEEKNGRYAKCEGKNDFCDCHGAEVIIKVIVKTIDKESGKQVNNLDFGGIYFVDEVDKATKKKASEGVAMAGKDATATPQPAKPKEKKSVDVQDL